MTSWYVWNMWRATGGNLCVPLDDSFIHFQYARQMARGYFLRYNTVDPATTGATSLLYVLVMAPYFWLPLAAEGAIAYALLIGIVCLVVSASLVRAIVVAHAWRMAGLLGGLLFACNGFALWGYLSGMEIALFGTLVLWLLWLVQRRDGLSFGWQEAVVGSLLVLTRPEGAALVLAMLALFLTQEWWQRGRGFAYRSCVAVLVPLVVFALQLGLYWWLTGTPLLAGQAAKDLMHEPGMRAGEFLRQFATGFVQVMFRDIGCRIMLVAGFIMVLITVTRGTYEEIKKRSVRWRALAGVWMFVGVAATCVLTEPGLHMNRYQIPLLGLFITCAALGWHSLCAWFERRGAHSRKARGLFCVGAVGLTSASLCQGTAYGLTFGRHCGEISRQHVQMAMAIKGMVPTDAVVATHDVGAVGFLGGRQVHDLIGLVTPNDPRTGRHGVASMYEDIEELPLWRKPTHYAVFPGWVDFADTGLLRPMASARLVRPTIGLPELRLYEADQAFGSRLRDLGLSKELSRDGYAEVDRLDVAHIASERQHRYEVDPGSGCAVSKTFLSCHGDARSLSAANVIDGGRRVLESESWVATVSPGRDTIVTMRTLSQMDAALFVAVKDREPSAKHIKAKPGVWLEWIVATIPAAEVQDDVLRVSVRPAPGAAFLSFHYWVYQKSR